jgi:hypothetical protein
LIIKALFFGNRRSLCVSFCKLFVEFSAESCNKCYYCSSFSFFFLHFLYGKKTKQKKPPRAEKFGLPLSHNPTRPELLGIWPVRPNFAQPVDMPTRLASFKISELVYFLQRDKIYVKLEKPACA